MLSIFSLLLSFTYMKIILLIIQREYLVRVRKKSFLIMTILGPLLIAGIYAIPAYLMLREGEKRTVAVIDESGLFDKPTENNRNISFVLINSSVKDAKAEVKKETYYALLHVPKNTGEGAGNQEVKLYSKKGASVGVESNIRKIVEDKIQTMKLRQAHIDTETLKQIESYRVAVITATLDEEKERESSGKALSIAGYAGGLLIYISIFLYGVQVMRGILEEKTNRIIEVIISSVKPFQLMMGKIIGIALVGLTQFLLWIILSFGISAGVQQITGIDRQAMAQPTRLPSGANTMENNVSPEISANTPEAKFWNGLADVLPRMIAGFLFYFLFGYLMYSAFFAAVGAASDADTDTQQFMFPISIPLIFSIVIAPYVDPDSRLAFWTSIIPLTSPVIMLTRLPFNPPLWEILLSMALLIGGFVGTTWLAARIYRVGILMYGKKVNYKELSKWIFYKG